MFIPRSSLLRALAPGVLLALSLSLPTLPAQAAKPGAASATTQAYPGTLDLQVDASNLAQQIFRMQLNIPVRPGPLTLLYPQWARGNHGPNIPLTQLAGLSFSANGKPLAWRRNPLRVHAIELVVPEGATTLQAQYQFLSPLDASQGRITMTDDMLGVQWQSMLLYPDGFDARRITLQPSLILPSGWQFASSLSVEQQQGDLVRFKPTDLDTLVDSPLFAGRHFKRLELAPAGAAPVTLNMMADSAEQLEPKPEQITQHRAMVEQMLKLFGARHYQRYDFLFAISDEFGGIGREHQQSSENGVKPGYFSNWAGSIGDHDLLPHEFVHSWNGKFRRPLGQDVANFNTPLDNSLLWVYEGQTQFWGKVIAARSGLLTPDQVREQLALDAARYDNVRGRDWRALQDTVNDPIINGRRPIGWSNWQRSEDYYVEGMLIWLDVDTKIRELSSDKRTLDDFARAFFGVDDGRIEPLNYTFEEVVATLNRVQRFDWAPFLRARLDSTATSAPLDGLTRAGWKLVYTDQPSDSSRGLEERSKSVDLSYSLGMAVRQDGSIASVVWDGVAYRAGLAANTTIVAVNQRSYKGDLLKAAVQAARDGKSPIELLVKKGTRLRTIKLDYTGGLRYPHLERIPGTRDRLQSLLAPLK